jgi:anti-sigma regulatory factor (Ser/Thr protein kinase)
MQVSETKFPADAVAAAAARRFVREAGIVPANRVDDVMLLVSELATNAVRHGPNEAGLIGVRITRSSDSVRVAVEDPGSGFADPTSAPKRPGSGMGLNLVDQLSTRWGIEGAGQTVVWFEIAGE